ncbi:MAG: hypothetical protein V4723_07375 [Pseudomonadota bacterium]
MRYVVRPAAPASLDGDECAGKFELLKATLHYAAPDVKTYPFKAYKRADVVQALLDAFSDKCAYCETNASAAFPIDVEHYRPKGGVAPREDPAHPGYWWLAGTWNNLLPSCGDCNRRRKHRIAIAGVSLDQLSRFGKQTSGKHSAFPIAGTRARAATDDHDQELPSLIDPTISDPARFIGWDVDGSLSLAVPKAIAGQPDPRATATIFTFGLNRQKLVEQRTRLAEEIKIEFTQIEFLFDESIATADPASRGRLIQRALATIASVQRRAAPNAPYSAMARTLIDAKLADIESRYASAPPPD